jgi:hypothetical protein
MSRTNPMPPVPPSDDPDNPVDPRLPAGGDDPTIAPDKEPEWDSDEDPNEQLPRE